MYKRQGILVVICIEGVLNQQHDFRKQQHDDYKLKLEDIADKISDKQDLIAINGEGSPQQIYFLHRKGWNLNDGEIINRVFTDSIAKKGCKFLFVNKRRFKENIDMIDYITVLDNNDYKVFKLGSQ